MQTNFAVYCPSGFVDSFDSSGNIKEGDWRKEVFQTNLVNIPKVRGSRYTTTAINLRESLAEYLTNAGAVDWQNRYVQSCGR